jgi:hypothetical protein
VEGDDVEDENGISAISSFIERLISNIVCEVTNMKIRIKNGPNSDESVELRLDSVKVKDLSNLGDDTREKLLEV